MHVVDDVHRLVVNASNLRQDELVVLHHLFEVERVARQSGDAFHHQCARLLAASAVERQQERLCQVAACAKELNLAADVLERYAASDSVVVAVAHFAHERVVFILN